MMHLDCFQVYKCVYSPTTSFSSDSEPSWMYSMQGIYLSVMQEFRKCYIACDSSRWMDTHCRDWLILSGTKCRRNWSEIYNLSSIKAASYIENKFIISSFLVSDFIPDYTWKTFCHMPKGYIWLTFWIDSQISSRIYFGHIWKKFKICAWLLFKVWSQFLLQEYWEHI